MLTNVGKQFFLYKCRFDHQNLTLLGGGGRGGGRLCTSILVSVPTLMTCIVVPVQYREYKIGLLCRLKIFHRVTKLVSPELGHQSYYRSVLSLIPLILCTVANKLVTRESFLFKLSAIRVIHAVQNQDPPPPPPSTHYYYYYYRLTQKQILCQTKLINNRC